jgi:alkylglycerol monooxygenase
VLFMASDSLLAINKFAQPLPASSLWILATYWAAQWAIASALRPSHPLEQPREAA